MNNLKELKKYILSNINPSWSNLEKIRYVYIISGKYLQKHTEFFLTLDNKLIEGKLSPKRLDKVYLGRLKTDEWNKMVCKSGAEFIKDVLSSIGINSTLVETVRYTKISGMKNHLHHYFLCVNTGDFNIFLTPAADYSLIQNGFCTLRFGSEISYMVDGEKFYKSNFEIPHKVLSRKDMKKLDDIIGFTTKTIKETKNGDVVETYYLEDIIKKNKSHYDNFLAMQTTFYNKIIPLNDDNKTIKFLSDKKNNWNDIIDLICKEVGNKIAEITNSPYKYNEYVSRHKINKWISYIDSMYNKSDYNIKDFYYSNPNLIFNKARSLCQTIINFCGQNSSELEKDDYIKFRTIFLKQLTDLSKHFIDYKYVLEPKDKNNYVSNAYINHKFSNFFPFIVSANSGFKKDIRSEGFSEQNEFIKRTIELMFADLNKKNLLQSEDDEFKLNPIFKRVNMYTYKNKDNNKYGIYFSISDSNREWYTSSYWYKYNLAENTFEKTSLTKIAIESSKIGKYEIISNRLKSVLNRIDDIEEAGNTGHLKLVIK